jgi:hypothetical protein
MFLAKRLNRVYRDSHESLIRTIEQLRSEVDPMRELRPVRRWRARVLLLVAIASAFVTVYAVAACVAAKARADDFERKFNGARARLEAKTRDLGQCESFAQQMLGRD